MSNLGSSVYYERPEGETTEWEDILREKGIIPPKEDPKVKAMKEAIEEAKEAAAAEYDPLARRTLKELDELEEDDAYADSRILDEYRKKRVAELKAAAARNKFGVVAHLSRDDFKKEVTEASKDCWVVVLLYKDGIPNSKLLEEVFPRVAAAHRSTKFLKIVADQCIERYPDDQVPALLLYHGGENKALIRGLDELGGKKVNHQTVEWVLSKHGAVISELDEDPRKGLGGAAYGGGGAASAYRRSAAAYDDDDD